MKLFLQLFNYSSAWSVQYIDYIMVKSICRHNKCYSRYIFFSPKLIILLFESNFVNNSTLFFFCIYVSSSIHFGSTTTRMELSNQICQERRELGCISVTSHHLHSFNYVLFLSLKMIDVILLLIVTTEKSGKITI